MLLSTANQYIQNQSMLSVINPIDLLPRKIQSASRKQRKRYCVSVLANQQEVQLQEFFAADCYKKPSQKNLTEQRNYCMYIIAAVYRFDFLGSYNLMANKLSTDKNGIFGSFERIDLTIRTATSPYQLICFYYLHCI